MYRSSIINLILIVFFLSGCQTGPYVFVGESENWNVKLNFGGEETDHVDIILRYKSSNTFPNDLISYVIDGENMKVDIVGERLNEDGTLRFVIFDIA